MLALIMSSSMAFSDVGFKPGDIDIQTSYFYEVPVTLQVEIDETAATTYTIEESYNGSTFSPISQAATDVTWESGDPLSKEFLWIPNKYDNTQNSQLQVWSNESGTYTQVDASCQFNVEYGKTIFTSGVEQVWLGKEITLTWEIRGDQIPMTLKLYSSKDNGSSWDVYAEEIENTGIFTVAIGEDQIGNGSPDHNPMFKLGYATENTPEKDHALATTENYTFRPLSVYINSVSPQGSAYVRGIHDLSIEFEIIPIPTNAQKFRLIMTDENRNELYNEVIGSDTQFFTEFVELSAFEFEEHYVGTVYIKWEDLREVPHLLNSTEIQIVSPGDKYFSLSGLLRGVQEMNDTYNITWYCTSEYFKTVKLEEKYNDKWVVLKNAEAIPTIVNSFEYTFGEPGIYQIRGTVQDGSMTPIVSYSETFTVIEDCDCQALNDSIAALNGKISELDMEIIELKDSVIVRIKDTPTDIAYERAWGDISGITNDNNVLALDIPTNEYTYWVWGLNGALYEEAHSVTHGTNTIDVNNFPSGVYILYITWEDTKKLYKFNVIH